MNPDTGTMKVEPLDGVPLRVLHEAFSAAFSDYTEPFSMSAPMLQYMLERRGYDASLSFGAFADGCLVGFILNGLGEWGGVPTAYDTGTGVRRAFRGRGVASEIFDESLPVLRGRGVRQYLLEVIRTNENAVRLYRKSGFAVSREFDYWTASPGSIRLAKASLLNSFSIAEIHEPDWASVSRFWDFQPSWQNSVESVMRKRDHVTIMGVKHREAIVAYACMERHSGDLPQLAVDPAYRRRGLATALVGQLLKKLRPPEFRVTNTCSNDRPMRSFLTGLGLKPGCGQFEMTLQL